MEQFDKYYEIGDLVVKYLQGDLEINEREKLNNWLNESDNNRLLFEELTDQNSIDLELNRMSLNDKEAAWASISAATKPDSKNKRIEISKIWRYAAVIAFVITSGLLYQQLGNMQSRAQKITIENDIDPGGNRATLTLSDGRKISLDEASTGELAKQQNILITKTADGQLVYRSESSDSHLSSRQVMNTISTPKGGQFQLILPDGTKVWLNSMSTLKFPVNFKGKERRVELTGEGYFDVSKNKGMPFIVKALGADVKVLGTQFNISAYSDEQYVETTLVEGSVRVSNGNDVQMLSPGMQSICGSSGFDGIRIIKADTEAVIAWKDGIFIFREQPIEELMAIISRWYDIEVKYEGNMKGKVFGGKFSKNSPLSELLKSLELTGTIKFNIEGRRVTAMP